MAEALGQAGRFADGIATVERGLDRSQRGWLAPELLRIKGELLLLQGTAGITEAMEDFRQALDEARRQEALSWELRAATSLARLLRHQSRTADLIAAKRLLDELDNRAPR